MSRIPVITIDGPSGVGKGTIAKMVAKHLGWHLLDSGVLYRATGYSTKKANISSDNVSAVAKIARTLPIRFEDEKILLRDEDITQIVRQEDVGNLASKVGAHLSVRQALDDLQRSFVKAPGLVADGRDMGTEIFPDAQYKFFLIASAEERARRRFGQLQASGIHVNIADLLREIEERDYRDKTRVARPLRPARDAVVIDTSSLSIDEVFNAVLRRISNS